MSEFNGCTTCVVVTTAYGTCHACGRKWGDCLQAADETAAMQDTSNTVTVEEGCGETVEDRPLEPWAAVKECFLSLCVQYEHMGKNLHHFCEQYNQMGEQLKWMSEAVTAHDRGPLSTEEVQIMRMTPEEFKRHQKKMKLKKRSQRAK